MNKMIKLCFSMLLIACIHLLSFNLNAQDASKSPSMVGTYIYMLEEQEGICIFTKSHVIFLVSNKNRKKFQAAEPSESEKAIAYMSAFADGGTYKFVGPSRITVHRLFSSNPGLVGQDFTFEYEFDGDICKYWILNADRSRGTMGTARRIEK